MRLRPGSRVAVERLDDVIYAAPLPDGPILVLEGAAAAIWLEACEHPRTAVPAAVAARTGQSAEAVAPQVEVFLDELVARGLLVDS